MAKIISKIKEKFTTKKEVVAEEIVSAVEQFDPAIPENKQRHLR